MDKAKGGLVLITRADATKKLKSGHTAVVPGRPDDSELFQLVTTTDNETRMPPPPKRRLSRDEVEVIRQWIIEGAPPFPKSE